MGDFEIDAVLYFMISKGGRVRNHELVTHFKNFLNHPNNKALNRDKFKDFVNELATIKLDGGEKVLVLKRKYRPLSDGGGGMTAPPLSSAPQKGGPLKKAVPSARPEPEDDSTSKSSGDDHHQLPQPQAPPRARSEPPVPENKSVPPQNEIRDSGAGAGDLGKVAKARSQELVEVDARSHMQRSEDAISTTSSSLSLASTNSQESSASATSGISSLEGDSQAGVLDMQRKQQERQPLSKIEDNVSVDSNSATPSNSTTTSSAEDVANISVMDKIKKLNKIHSETDLHHPKHTARKNSKFLGGEEEDYHIALGPEEKEWMLVCSAAEYHEINRLLCKDASLAKLQDFTNGYTALHWAAKAGKPEIIKMIANRPGVNIDQRSHGGYTALHLAAIHGHEQIIELLVQTFKADANLRDYSGKKAKQYLKNSASSKAQRKRIYSLYSSSSSNSLIEGLPISSNQNSSSTQVVSRTGVKLSISDPIPFVDSSSAV